MQASLDGNEFQIPIKELNQNGPAEAEGLGNIPMQNEEHKNGQNGAVADDPNENIHGDDEGYFLKEDNFIT